MEKRMNRKLKVLESIAEALNRSGIRWALRASCMLYLRGIVSDFHDIDLMIDEEDSSIAIEVLKTLGTMKDPDSSSSFQTACFREFSIEGTDVDMIAGMAIVNKGIAYHCSLTDDTIDCTVHLHDQDIPLQSLAAWRRYYELMGRTEKVRMIDESITMQKQDGTSSI